MKAIKQPKSIKRSISRLSSKIDTNPNDPVLYYQRGIEWSQRGVYDLALADFTRAITLKDDFARAYYGRGTVYNTIKEYEKAKKDFYKSHTLLKKIRNTEDVFRRN